MDLRLGTGAVRCRVRLAGVDLGNSRPLPVTDFSALGGCRVEAESEHDINSVTVELQSHGSSTTHHSAQSSH